MNKKLVVNSATTCAEAVSEIKAAYHDKKYLRVRIQTGRDRSLDQNALFHQWIAILVQKGGEFTFDGYRNMCRLHFFVPILRAENQEFRDVYDRCLLKLPYPDKLDAMGLVSGVSSICTTEQFSRALEEMQLHFSTLTTNPVFLEFEDE